MEIELIICLSKLMARLSQVLTILATIVSVALVFATYVRAASGTWPL